MWAAGMGAGRMASFTGAGFARDSPWSHVRGDKTGTQQGSRILRDRAGQRDPGQVLGCAARFTLGPEWRSHLGLESMLLCMRSWLYHNCGALSPYTPEGPQALCSQPRSQQCHGAVSSHLIRTHRAPRS